MKLNQIVELMQGELHNVPAIDAFSGIAFKLNALKKGFLFFANNIEEIDAAIAMGAYGIVYDKNVHINDIEIAWIKVRDIDESILRLLRYFLLVRKIEVLCLQYREFEIFKQICIDEEVLCYEDNVEFLVECLFTDKSYKVIVFSNTKPLQYALDFTPSVIPKEKILDIRVATLFDIRFYYKLMQYHLNLPILFAGDLSAVLYLCENYHINIDLNLFKELDCIKPNFIDATPKILEYGASEKVVIAQEILQDFKNYVEYIALNGKWGKMIIFIPLGCKEVFSFPTLFYQDEEELFLHIKKECFNFGLIFGIKNTSLIDIFEKYIEEKMVSLFDIL